jgi:hypothetical protein
MPDEETDSVSLLLIAAFLLIVLGVGVAVIGFVGGSLIGAVAIAPV